MALKLLQTINLKRLLPVLGEALGGQLEIGRMHWTYNNGLCLEAHAISFTGTKAFSGVAKAERLRFRVSLFSLLTGRLVIKNLSLLQPDISLNFSKSSSTQGSQESQISRTPPPVTVELHELSIVDGQVVIEDSHQGEAQPAQIRLEEIYATVKNSTSDSDSDITFSTLVAPSDRPAPGNIKGRGKVLRTSGRFDFKSMHMQLEAELEGLDAGLLGHYLSRQDSETRLGGHLSGQISFIKEPKAAGLLNSTLVLGDLSLQNDDYWPHVLTGVPTHLISELKFNDDHIGVRVPRLAIGDIITDGRFNLYHRNERPLLRGLTLTAQIPLVAAAPLVPWRAIPEQAGTLQEFLASGGHIHIEKLALPDIDCTSPQLSELLNGSTARINLRELSTPSSTWLPRLKNIGGELHLQNGAAHSDNLSACAGPFLLPLIELKADGFTTNFSLATSAQGRVLLAGTTDSEIDQSLRSYGISRFTGSAHVDLRASYSHGANPALNAVGEVDLRNLDITTIRSSSSISLDGRIDVNLAETLAVKFTQIGGQVNEAPFKLDGIVSAINSPNLLVDLEAQCTALDIAPVAEIVSLPEFDDVGGVLDIDTRLRFLQGQPAETTFDGQIVGHELSMRHLPSGLDIGQGEAQLRMKSNRIQIQAVELTINGQPLSFRGAVTDFQQRIASLHFNSTQFNIDKLLPAIAADEPESADSEQIPSSVIRLLQGAELTLSANVEKGSYKRRTFTNLSLAAGTKQGRIESHSFSVGIAEGRINTRGSIDLTNLHQIGFDLRYDLKSVHLEKFLPLFLSDNRSFSGPLSCKGAVTGRSGSDWLESLRGNLFLKAGPGKIPRVGALGDALHSTLALVRFKGQLTGTLSATEAATIIPLDYFYIQANFTEGLIEIPAMNLNTPAMKSDWNGTLTVPEKILAMEVKVSLIGSLDTAMELVPVLGSTARKISKVYLRLDGPLNNPTVEKTLHNSIDELSKNPIKTIEKSVGKSLNNFRKFWS